MKGRVLVPGEIGQVKKTIFRSCYYIELVQTSSNSCIFHFHVLNLVIQLFSLIYAKCHEQISQLRALER